MIQGVGQVLSAEVRWEINTVHFELTMLFFRASLTDSQTDLSIYTSLTSKIRR